MERTYSELFEYIISCEVKKQIEKSKPKIQERANSLAVEILAEVLSILRARDLSDFDIVEKIVCIMEKYDIDCGACHDFG